MNAARSIARHDVARRAALDPWRPQASFVEPERSDSGEILSVATLFLTNRQCPWRCVFCDLWKNTLPATVPAGAIPAQIDHALNHLAATPVCERPTAIRQIKLYNAGSFFDPKAIPPADFPAIAARVSRFERVIVECHPALVGPSAVRFRDLLRTSATHAARLEIAMGLEIADDAILARLNKRMTLARFARTADFLREHDIALRAFVMVKPPFVRSEEAALAFAARSVDFAFDCGATAVSLIPARPGTEELARLATAGDFAPPKLATLEAAFEDGLRQQRGRVFADLWNLQEFAGCTNCCAGREARLRRMNLTQVVVPAVPCGACGEPGKEKAAAHSSRG